MSHLDSEVLTQPRFDYLHRLLVAGVVIAISGLLVFALVGTAGLIMALLAVVIRLTLTPELILKYHPRFRRARALSRVVAAEAYAELDQLVEKAGLSEAPKLLVSDRASLDAQTISTPFGAVIVVTRDMLQALSRQELAGVLAHEIGHIKNRDGYIAWGLNTAALLALIFVVTGALLGWSRLEGLNTLALQEEHAVIIAMTVISALAMLFNVVVLRALENDADLTAVAMTGNPAALASALAKHPPVRQGGFASLLDAHRPLGAKGGRRRITLAGDKGFDVAGFVEQLRARKVTPHVAVQDHLTKTGKRRKTKIDGRTTRHPGYMISQRIRKRIEEVFGWVKVQGGQAKTKFRGRPRVNASFTLALAAYNLIRLPKLLEAPP